MWMLSGMLLALLLGAAIARLPHRGRPDRAAVFRSLFLIFAGCWLVLELATYWRWMHYTWVFSTRGFILALALPFALAFAASTAVIEGPSDAREKI